MEDYRDEINSLDELRDLFSSLIPIPGPDGEIFRDEDFREIQEGLMRAPIKEGK